MFVNSGRRGRRHLLATIVLRLLKQFKENAVKIQMWIESMPLWEKELKTPRFDLPQGVVAWIGGLAHFAAEHGARVPRIEIKLPEATQPQPCRVRHARS